MTKPRAVLDTDPRISGILILGPSPASIEEVELYRVRKPVKDIEAVTPVHSGRPERYRARPWLSVATG